MIHKNNLRIDDLLATVGGAYGLFMFFVAEVTLVCYRTKD